ncbi:MAG TPA: SUMF1/EgtB/PvdO family nonheme iron enzyme [Kofleriaceae bacterium]|nr:SUMF1/EgtB/PvdO family nonheme iron enzyme [Kofleriaceae bacterium]
MKHTILFLAANPREAERLALDQEARAIQHELERARYRDSFELATRWAVQPLDLLRDLRTLRPTVLHFSGHGGPAARAAGGVRRDIVASDADSAMAGLFFHGSDGQAQRVSGEAIREAFALAGTTVRVAVLNACYTEPLAHALRQHIDCVIGTDGAILDDAARRFSIGFYGGLGAGASVAAAFEHGRVAVSLEGQPGEARPQLTVRDGKSAERIVLVEQRPRRTGWVGRLVIGGATAGAALAGAFALSARERAPRPPAGSEAAGSAGVAPPAAPVDPDMVAFRATTFAMGSSPAEIAVEVAACQDPACHRDLFDREGPVRTVALSAFAIDRREVTNEAFARWLASTGAEPDRGLVRQAGAVLLDLAVSELAWVNGRVQSRPGTERHPVAGVSAEAARAYCAARGKRLPTEAEWEYAARGDAHRRFPWGDSEPAALGCAIQIGEVGDDRCRDPRPVADVGSTADVTPEGVYDLADNVSEWVADRFAASYPRCEPCRDPIVAAGDEQVIRGGNHVLDASVARAGARSKVRAGTAAAHTGFRCARSR